MTTKDGVIIVPGLRVVCHAGHEHACTRETVVTGRFRCDGCKDEHEAAACTSRHGFSG